MAVPFYIPDQNKLGQQKKTKGTNISIPVDQNLAQSNYCWELIVRAFCDALKQYYLQSISSSSGFIRISFEYKPSEKLKKTT